MTPNLQSFIRALTTPDLSFATLTGARPVTGPDGLPELLRTTRFAEARIEWRGEQWLLSMPLAPAAMYHIERTASALRRFNSPLLAEYRILPAEMRWHDALDEERSADLVLQHLPAGCDFDEALLSEPHDTLLAALDTLQTGLRELGLSHNNLKAANLRWSGGRLIPIRYHDARLGEGDDTAAFDALRHTIAQTPGPHGVSDTTAAYEPRRILTGHLWTSHVFEGLVCVEDPSGYGYVDTNNNPVIPARFLWAGDFREGRAEVQTPDGMGLIDREGSYVIDPTYEIVEYDPAASIVHVRLGGAWALFDYLGRRLTEFSPRNGVEAACGSEICN